MSETISSKYKSSLVPFILVALLFLADVNCNAQSPAIANSCTPVTKESAASANGVQGNWWEIDSEVAEDGPGAYYYDRDTVRRDGDLLTVWTLSDHRDVQAGSGVTYCSSRDEMEFDCVKKLARLVKRSWYSLNMAHGDVVRSTANPQPWADAPEDGIRRPLADVLCSIRDPNSPNGAIGFLTLIPAGADEKSMARGEEILRGIAETANKNLNVPRQLMPDVTLDRITAGPGRRLTYKISLANRNRPDDVDAFRKGVLSNMALDICSDEYSRALLRRNVVIARYYRFSDGFKLGPIDFVPAGCAESRNK